VLSWRRFVVRNGGGCHWAGERPRPLATACVRIVCAAAGSAGSYVLTETDRGGRSQAAASSVYASARLKTNASSGSHRRCTRKSGDRLMVCA
jgi:hypothetical protein